MRAFAADGNRCARQVPSIGALVATQSAGGVHACRRRHRHGAGAGAGKTVTDIRTSPLSSNPANFVPVGNVVFFTASTPETGIELWRSDGTEVGTVAVKDILPAPAALRLPH